MINRILLICFFINVFVIGYGQIENEILKGQPVPNFIINSDNGKVTEMHDLKGKIVLINMFATWCAPCREELPLLQEKIWLKYKDNEKFSLLSFGRGHSLKEINKFKAANKFDFPMYPDKNKSIFSLFAKYYIPRNYIVDEKGVIVYTSVGFSNQEFEKMINYLDSLLAN